MGRDDLLRYCVLRSGAWVDEPWEGDQVVKVGDKIFAFFGAVDGSTIGLNADGRPTRPGSGEISYPDYVTLSAYIGRYGWNTFVTGSAISDAELLAACHGN